MPGRERATMLFTTKHGREPSGLVRSPGRINLIGDHTDYTGGLVLPTAIDRALWVAFRPRDDRVVRVRSEAFVDDVFIDLDGLVRSQGWGEYVKGVAWALEESGNRLQGWDGVITSDVAMAAGLSSSGALTVAIVAVFSQVADLGWDPASFAEIAQRAENQWVGVHSGIMDPLVATAAREGYAMLIDCRDLETLHVPIPAEAAFVVMDTGTRRNLLEAGYNRIRSQCEAAAGELGCSSLRDLTSTQFAEYEGLIDPPLLRCARHVVTENERTLAAADALGSGRLVELGRLMNESHVSLRDLLGVSSRPLDAIVQAAQSSTGCYGARLTGGGYAGAAIALVDRTATEEFISNVEDGFHDATGLQGHCYVAESASGTSFEKV
ncbi:MAG: galactokinase [Acidimicrobiia bacterium]